MNKVLNKKAIVIIGPTSSGKTSAALKLCQEFNGEIISADSRQIYKGLDIGTGKIPVNLDKSDISKQKIWLYDLVNPDVHFSAYDFKIKAEECLQDIWKNQKIPFIVGGTGFYLSVLLGLQEVSAISPDLELRQNLEKLTTEELVKKLTEVAPERLVSLDLANRRRLIRAIEVASQPVTSNRQPTGLIDPLVIVFTGSRELLYKRVDGWVEAVIKAGLINEVKNLVKAGYGEASPLHGLIYNQVLAFLDGQTSQSELLQRIKYDLHRCIRKQETYFRKMFPNSKYTYLDISGKDFGISLKTVVQSYLDNG